MARLALTCLLLLSTSLHHVISFAVHKRHSRSTDLADALRMLERQRRHFGGDEDILASPPLLGDDNRPLTLADLEPWYNSPPQGSPPEEETLDASWLAKSLGLDGYNGEEDLPEEDPYYLRRPPLPPAPVKVQPTDQELDAIFGEKSEEKARSGEPSTSPSKKDKEVMTDMKGDVKEETVALPQVRSPDAAVAAPVEVDVMEAKTSESSDDVKLTREEFKALLKAVEKLQKQAIDKAEDEIAEAGEVLAEVKEKVAEAREEAKEEQEEEEEAKAKEEAEAEEAREAGVQTPEPQPVSKEELDTLFEDQSKEVIPTENGQIVKTEKTLTDSQGHPVGREEMVEEVEEGEGPGKTTLNSIEDFWYLKNYMDQDGDRKKRNSKRSFIPPSYNQELSLPEVISPPDSSELIAAYIKKINELQSELDQTKLEAYLEDVENDILTDALNQATLAQVQGRINPDELTSLQDAIRVEEALQMVKSSRLQGANLAEALVDDLTDDEQDDDNDDDVVVGQNEKRGEPWKKRNDVTHAEVPVFLTGDSDGDDVTEGDDVGDDSEEETTSVALGKWLDQAEPTVSLDDILEATAEDLGYRGEGSDDDLIGRPGDTKVASLFSNKADDCPAVQEFSSNCDFAGDSIDFEARALCNVHEMCYVCGESLGVGQSQCDFIYRAASTMLCRQDDQCVREAQIFLNTMKLKHRFVPYSQPICRSRCAAEFLSIV